MHAPSIHAGPAAAKDDRGNPYVLWLWHGGNERQLMDALQKTGADTVFFREGSRCISRGSYRARLTVYRGGECVTEDLCND